ncbi:MAG: hypothetical protein WCP68_24530, partial [Enhydrobacter sp.]
MHKDIIQNQVTLREHLANVVTARKRELAAADEAVARARKALEDSGIAPLSSLPEDDREEMTPLIDVG